MYSQWYYNCQKRNFFALSFEKERERMKKKAKIKEYLISLQKACAGSFSTADRKKNFLFSFIFSTFYYYLSYIVLVLPFTFCTRQSTTLNQLLSKDLMTIIMYHQTQKFTFSCFRSFQIIEIYNPITPFSLFLFHEEKYLLYYSKSYL